MIYYYISDTYLSRNTDDVKFTRTLNDGLLIASMWNLDYVIGSSTHGLRMLLQNNDRNLGVYLDARCNNYNYTIIYAEVKKKKIQKNKNRPSWITRTKGDILLFKATRYSMYDEMHKWLILGRKLDDIVQSLIDDAFGVVTDITIAVPSLTGYDLYDVYNPCKARGGSLNVTALGYWTEKSGVSIKLEQSRFERRANLYGMRLKVGILVSIQLR